MSDQHSFSFFSGTSHPELASQIAKKLGIEVGKATIAHFEDGEISVEIQETVRGKTVFVLQSLALRPNEYLVELLLMIDALKRASAEKIVAVIPYYGYGRQDRKDKPRVPISAKLLADLLQSAGVEHLLTMDLHAEQVQGFFDIPVDNLYGMGELVRAIEALKTRELVVVAPDIGSVKLARAFARSLGASFAVVDKERISSSEARALEIIGDVQGRDVLLADDICSTGGTVVSAALASQEKGARRIFAAMIHGLCVGPAVERIEKSPIETLFTTNTIPWSDRFEGLSKIQTVSVAPLFAQAIQCIVSKGSLENQLVAYKQRT